jgi:D-amino-acid dehydrogenase
VIKATRPSIAKRSFIGATFPVDLDRDGVDDCPAEQGEMHMIGGQFDAIVLGAGMPGSASAAQLALRGLRVALIDRKAPGDETSFGNAGYIDTAAFIPATMPRDLGTLLRRLRGDTPHVHVQFTMLPFLLGWFRQYWKESSPERILAAAARLAPLSAHAVEEHKKLAAEAGVPHLITANGLLRGYRSRSGFAGGASDRDLLRRYGIEVQELDTAGIAELEPCLLPVLANATFIPRSHQTIDPGGLTKAYATLVTRSGGAIMRADASSLTRKAGGWTLETPDGPVVAPHVVVALGPWAKEFLAGFGMSVPIAVKRGYHMHYALAGNATLGRPITDMEGGFAINPMVMGIRLTTGAEFAHRDAPPTTVQLDASERLARGLVPLEGRIDTQAWRGARPNTPDSAPIIGPAPGQPGMWLAVGHGHWGMGLGAVTGRVIADLVCGTTPVCDPAPLGLGRFS